jgi:hypothetical protein
VLAPQSAPKKWDSISRCKTDAVLVNDEKIRAEQRRDAPRATPEIDTNRVCREDDPTMKNAALFIGQAPLDIVRRVCSGLNS